MSRPVTPQPAPEHPRPAVLLAAVLALVAATYAPSLGGPFIWDDHALIEEQESVKSLQPLGEYFTRMFWSDPLAIEARHFYRPVVTLSYALDWALGAGRPFQFHLTNLAAHLGCAALLFFVLRRAGAKGSAAAAGAALWATLPRLTESVAWISGRTDVFACLGVLAALLLWPAEKDSLARRAAAAGALLFGLFCKEVAFAGLAGIAAFEIARVLRRQASLRQVALRLLPLAVASGAYAAARAGLDNGPTWVREFGPARALIVLEALGTYAWMVVDALRPRTQIGLLGVPNWALVSLGALAAGAGLYGLVRFVRSRPAPLHAALAAAGLSALAMVVHVVPLDLSVVAADRFLYLPSMALALAAALALSRLGRKSLAGAAALAIAFSFASRVRIADWSDELRFWKDATATAHPLNSIPHGSFGDVLSERGLHRQAAEQYRMVLEKFDRSLEVSLGQRKGFSAPAGRLNLAVSLQALGDYRGARKLMDDLMPGFGTWKRLVYGRVMLELRQLDPDAAERELARSPEAAADPVGVRLAGVIASIRGRLADLPAERPGEPVAVTARRAELYDELGAIFDASRSWKRVLDSPEAPDELARKAAGYLAFKAPPEEARAALDKLLGRTRTDEVIQGLMEQVQLREAELAVVTAPR